MNHLLEDYWEDLRWEALITWQKLNLAELNQVNGNKTVLEEIIKREYRFSTWLIRKQINELVKRYDDLDYWADWHEIEPQLSSAWPLLDPYDIKYISGSRIRMLRLLEAKYGWSRENAMDEVNSFLRQFLD